MTSKKPEVGSVGWIDLTVEDAPALRDFYAAVVGWKPEPVPMGEYDDYSMADGRGTARAGVCHKRGSNAGLPAAWIAYFVVADLERSLREVSARGGKVLEPPRGEGGRFAIVEDPAGAVCALYQAG
jgi:predicted enzyme related to lactoylglutathione lyase